MPVTITAGETTNRVVAITTPAGSIQGRVLQTLHDGSTTPVTDGDAYQVALLAGTTEVATTPPGPDGGFLFDDLAAGSYSVVVRENEGDAETPVWAEVQRRDLTVLSGQGLAVDLVLAALVRPVTVTATSTNGTDLTGALATLRATIDGQVVTLGPQPLARTSGTYAATFAQVPAGSWTASISGPAGHHGTYRGEAFTVGASSPAQVATEVTVTETEIRLVASLPAGTSNGPTSVAATVAADGDGGDDVDVDDVDVTLIPGASDTLLYVPSVGWDISAELGATWEDTWQLTVAPTSVPASAVRQIVRITLEQQPISTTTTIDVDPSTVVLGGSLGVTADVAAGDDVPTGGSVVLERRAGTSGPWGIVETKPFSGDTLRSR